MAAPESEAVSLTEKQEGRSTGEESNLKDVGAAQSSHSSAVHESNLQQDQPTPDAEKAAQEQDQPQPQQDAAPAYDKNFEVSWDGADDPNNPQAKKLWKKWAQVLITCGTATCVTCTSTLWTTTYDQLQTDLGSSKELSTAGVSLFVFALGISPMIFSPLSEFYGRRPIYIFSMAFFIIWLIPCAVAQNMQTMLVARFIDGFAGSAFLTVAGGTVGDLFTKMTLQLPMLIFTSAPFMGPVIGPIIGGFVNTYANWRWSFYLLIIWAVFQWILIIFFVPETYHPVLLRNKARKLREETGDSRWHAPIEKLDRSVAQTVLHSCYRPFMLLVREPMCLNLCLLSAVLLAILYLFFGAFELVFGNIYGFTLWQVGLTFCGIGLGMVIAIASDPLWHSIYARLVQKREQETGIPGDSEPEFRLPSAVLGAPLSTIGLFWFGFTIYPHIHWIVPILGSVLFGCGMILSFSGVFTFLVDAYPLYAASALAANSFVRSTAAAAFPLFGNQMYERLGYQWATGLLAFLCLALAPFPYIFFKYGERIRQRSRFATSK